MKVGVLALQGDVREHISSLIACGVDPIAVRRSSEIDQIDALVLPGGESTTIAQLSEVFGIYEQLKGRISQGMPVYGSCAGMILLALKQQILKDLVPLLPVHILETLEIVTRRADALWSEFRVGPGVRLQATLAIFHVGLSRRICLMPSCGRRSFGAQGGRLL
jgi:pyridoxal 5'-phosphate synthase glutaminase subunit Pdx2